MKAGPACIPCLFRQAQNTIRTVTGDPALHETVYRALAASIGEISLEATPTEISYIVYRTIRETTGVTDPFLEEKHRTNELALRLLPRLEQLIVSSMDPLRRAVHVAAAGNVIDLGICDPTTLEEEIDAILCLDFAVDNLDDLRRECARGKRLLYIVDNAGEILFDRLLVQQIAATGIEVTFTVKSGPVINDVTMEDAPFAVISNIASVIETGSDDIGVNWHRCSREFRDAFHGADMVLCKGRGTSRRCRVTSTVFSRRSA
ncbi:MAG: DUF89 family protein [Spirochaetes bacterium]|nr:DUF89 family protein [Spirochaetota bacterium]